MEQSTTPGSGFRLATHSSVPPAYEPGEAPGGCTFRAEQDGTVTGRCLLDLVWSRLDVGMLRFDLDEGRVWRNQAALDLLEKVLPEASDERLQELFLTPRSVRGSGMGARRRPEEEVRIGSTVLGCSTFRSAPDHFLVILRDVTEQRRLEAIAEAANLMENIGYVFGAIRHELGNPINVIKMTLSVFARNLPSMSTETIAEYIERLTAEVGRVEYLLTSLKSFSIYDSPQIAVVSVSETLERFEGLVAEELRRRDIALSVLVAPGAEQAVADPRALQQVLLNLVTNAVDALAGRPEANIDIRAYVDGHRLNIDVQDNGAGIPNDQIAHLFKPFRTTKPKGTGLGLVIVKKMLTGMNGSVHVTSEVGSGTTVTLSLPLPEGPRRSAPPTVPRKVAEDA